jgi:hypothetical protein
LRIFERHSEDLRDVMGEDRPMPGERHNSTGEEMNMQMRTSTSNTRLAVTLATICALLPWSGMLASELTARASAE